MTETPSPADDEPTAGASRDEPAGDDPRDTDHPAGAEHASRNRDDEPAG